MGGPLELGKTGILVALKENREAAYNLVICLLCSLMKGVPFWLKAFERVTILFFDLEVSPSF